MKYVKVYEEFRPFDHLKRDIEGIFVELKDLRYEISVDDLPNYFLLELCPPNEVDMRSKKHRDIIKECVLMYIEYMRIYYREFSSPNRSYTLFTNYLYYFSEIIHDKKSDMVKSKDMLLEPKYYNILRKPVIKMGIKIKKR